MCTPAEHSPGLRGSQSPHSSPGRPDHGLHPRRQDHRIPVRTVAKVFEGRRPVCPQNCGGLRRKIARHKCAAGGGSGFPGPVARITVGFEPDGSTIIDFLSVGKIDNQSIHMLGCG